MIQCIFLASSIALFASQAIAHGEIEFIKCKDSSKKIQLQSVSVDEKLNATFELKQIDSKTKKFEATKLSLKDSAEDGKVIENITFSLGTGKAHLKIIEDYTKTLREGTGTLSLPKQGITTSSLVCKVKYPKD